MEQKDFSFSNFFSSPGCFLNIGANSGMDTTYELLLNGWRGIYVDSNPFAFMDLHKRVQPYLDKVSFINSLAVPNKHDTSVTLFTSPYNHGMSSILPDWFGAQGNITSESFKHLIELKSKAFKVEELFDIIGYDIDYINIDTEGLCSELVMDLPIEKLSRLKVIEYETSTPSSREFLNTYGFGLFVKKINWIMVRGGVSSLT
jgi:hypothetical protein